MKDSRDIPSLLPYLSPRTTAACRISVIPEDSPAADGTLSPFSLIVDSDPLTRLIKAGFTTDSGSIIRDTFLLLQRDDYHLPENQISPITNSIVEELWQRAFAYYSATGREGSFITLSQQMGKKGQLIPLQSLFYCKAERLFFHPPCPACGFGLKQCYDDNLLTTQGLRKYSTSLSRYLYCPSCFSPGTARSFYAYEPGSFDPPIVKDRTTLIREFRLLVRSRNAVADMPCMDCEQSEECYGPDGLAESRIVPFSFYPFFMLIFDSMPVSALDFLAMISGGPRRDLLEHLAEKGEKGKSRHLTASMPEQPAAVPFLFFKDDRFFLEVLYLKLSFLSRVIREIFSNEGGSGEIDLSASVEKIWVKLTGENSLLPYFWNFELKLISIFREPPLIPPHLRQPVSYRLYLLGFLWLHVLLVNSRQTASVVHRVVESLLSNTGQDNQPRDFMEPMADPVFDPVNIFWQPGDWTVKPEWHKVWRESLHLGWSLFNAGLQSGVERSTAVFQQRVDRLREEIKEELFSGKPDRESESLPSHKEHVEAGSSLEDSVSEPLSTPGEDKAIGNILTHIAEKWRKEQESAKSEAEHGVEDTTEFEITEETFILPASGPEDDTLSPALRLKPKDKKEEKEEEQDEDAMETVIISASRASGKSSGPLPDLQPRPPKDAPAPELLRQESASREASSSPAAFSPDEDDLLAETIIISKGKSPVSGPSRHPAQPSVKTGDRDSGLRGGGSDAQAEEDPLKGKKELKEEDDEDGDAMKTIVLPRRKGPG